MAVRKTVQEQIATGASPVRNPQGSASGRRSVGEGIGTSIGNEIGSRVSKGIVEKVQDWWSGESKAEKKERERAAKAEASAQKVAEKKAAQAAERVERERKALEARLGKESERNFARAAKDEAAEEKAREKALTAAQRAADKSEAAAQRAADKAEAAAQRAVDRAEAKENARIAAAERQLAKEDDVARLASIKKKEAELAKLDEFTQGKIPSAPPSPSAPATPDFRPSGVVNTRRDDERTDGRSERPKGGKGGGGKGGEPKQTETEYKQETQRLVLNSLTGSGGRGTLEWLRLHGPTSVEGAQSQKDAEERERKIRKEAIQKEIAAEKKAHREFIQGPPKKDPPLPPSVKSPSPGAATIWDADTGKTSYVDDWKEPAKDDWRQ